MPFAVECPGIKEGLGGWQAEVKLDFDHVQPQIFVRSVKDNFMFFFLQQFLCSSLFVLLAFSVQQLPFYNSSSSC